MRLFLSTLAISLLFVHISCSVADREETNLRDPEPILEIWQDVGGMVEISGQSLFLRMYSDGLVEYEVPDRHLATTGISKRIEDIKVLKHGYLSSRKRKVILELLSSAEIPKFETTYDQRPCMDTFLTLDINININQQKKNLRIEDCDLSMIKRTEHPSRKVLPRLIADLITEADIARIN